MRKAGRASELAKLGNDTKADILLLSETWLRPKNPSPRIAGFGLVNRTDRDDGTLLGGGVMTYARPGLPVTCQGTRRGDKAEVEELDVRLGNSGRFIPISHFYISPDSTSRFHWQKMVRSDTILFGDCNIHGSWGPGNCDPNTSQVLEEYLEATCRIILNNGSPTLFTPNGKSAVDVTACPGAYVMECQ